MKPGACSSPASPAVKPCCDALRRGLVGYQGQGRIGQTQDEGVGVVAFVAADAQFGQRLHERNVVVRLSYCLRS